MNGSVTECEKRWSKRGKRAHRRHSLCIRHPPLRLRTLIPYFSSSVVTAPTRPRRRLGCGSGLTAGGGCSWRVLSAELASGCAAGRAIIDGCAAWLEGIVEQHLDRSDSLTSKHIQKSYCRRCSRAS
jgi:hypothetical protein